ncbi:MAG TPA: hypothetical protein P5117_11100 [Spirochaetia bacterium]|nr:hypothetical protein [Spirochaetia bacterium]
MDSKVVNERAEDLRDSSIRVTPALLEELGIVKSDTVLRVGDFSVSCVPFELSLSRMELLAVLSEREAEFFQRYLGQSHRLFMTCRPPYGSKPHAFFLTCRISGIRRPSPVSPYCFLGLELVRSPLSYKEMLVGYFLETEKSRDFFETAPEIELSPEQRSALLGGGYLQLLLEEGEERRFKVLSFTPRRVTLFGEYGDSIPADGAVLEFRPTDTDEDFELKGVCLRSRPSVEAPGFSTLELELRFTPGAFARIRRVVGWMPGIGRNGQAGARIQDRRGCA